VVTTHELLAGRPEHDRCHAKLPLGLA
jgi:hypothetical protein